MKAALKKRSTLRPFGFARVFSVLAVMPLDVGGQLGIPIRYPPLTVVEPHTILNTMDIHAVHSEPNECVLQSLHLHT